MPEHIRQEPKVLVSTENLTEQEWLAYRRQGIGGSDVAAILGISPFRTARDLYDDKLNIASAVDDTGNWVALEMGHLLEPLVAQIFTKKTGLEVFQIKKMFQHPQYPFMLADVTTCTFCQMGEIALLEIKNDQLQRERPLVEGRRGICSRLLRTILFDDRWASAREDLARAYYNNDESALNGSFIGLGKTIADEAAWYAGKSDNADLKAVFNRVAAEAGENASESAETSRFAGDIAVVTGVAPNSIAAQVVNGLLAGGATVVATSHQFQAKREGMGQADLP